MASGSIRSPGPQSYWVSPKINYHNKKANEDTDNKTSNENDDTKVYHMNREKTDKRVSKPMRSYVF